MFGEKCLLLGNGHELCSTNGQNDNVLPFNLLKYNSSLKVQKPLFFFWEKEIIYQSAGEKIYRLLFASTIEKYFCQKNNVLGIYYPVDMAQKCNNVLEAYFFPDPFSKLLFLRRTVPPRAVS